VPTTQSVPGRCREGMMVVVPGLPEGDRSEPREVLRLIAGRGWSPAKGVA
jgi:hypothetical protein